MKLVAITPEFPGLDELQSSDPFIEEIVEGTRRMYSVTGYAAPWSGYLAAQEGVWVGTCAFKCPPQGNRVEIAYFTLPQFQGQGIGTSMAEQLIEIARQASTPPILFAQTMPESNGSTRILEKLGFTRIAEVQHPQDGLVWEWELTHKPDKPRETTAKGPLVIDELT